MKFFFPDSQDFIDPGFDLAAERYSKDRVRQRTDQYAHEYFPRPPYDGLLVSRWVVMGETCKNGGRRGEDSGKYTEGQRQRLLDEGVQKFFRLKGLLAMGDCGAFNYVNEPEPPVTVDQVIDFYQQCRFDWGVSVDHIILAYDPGLDAALPGVDLVPEKWRKRQEITLTLAAEFLRKSRGLVFQPVGVAQGWSPQSYTHSVRKLQKMGYRRIGLGGMVGAKNDEVLACLEAVNTIRKPDTELHLFGLERCELVHRLQGYGVTSFDSTSPLKQALKDDKNNYYALEGEAYLAVRVPQVRKCNPLLKQIKAGKIDQAEAVRRESACLDALREYEARANALEGLRKEDSEKAVDAISQVRAALEDALAALRNYEKLHSPAKDCSAGYRRTLTDRPWKDCTCKVCTEAGYHVLLFRRAETNRRRGFHNLWLTYQQLQSALGREEDQPMIVAALEEPILANVESSTLARAQSKGDLRVHALQSRQGRDRVLYSFWVDGKQIDTFTAVARLGRDGDQHVFGYQRPEVLPHIDEIRRYLESDNPMLPNAIVVAFDPVVRFEPYPGVEPLDGSRPGTLIIPRPEDPAARMPAWIVDGQQRSAALREAAVKGFSVCVVGFVAASETEQREQFILVNSTKPLAKGLIYELLPVTDSHLPSSLQKRRFPTQLLNRLNLDEGPLQGRIQTPTRPDGLIKDNSLLSLLESSLSEGVLYHFRDPEKGDDVKGMLDVLNAFWSAVAATFPDAWNLPPKKSRLLHGAGVRAMGHLMDAIANRREAGVPTADQFRKGLEAIAPVCRWTGGYWEFGPGVQRKWNELQNTSKDIGLLTNYLLVQYRTRGYNLPDGASRPV